MTWPQSLLQWPVVLYAILMVAGLVAPPLIFAVQRRNRARRRAAANLPPDVMMDYSERLAQSRWEAGLQAGAFVVTLVGVPLLLLGIEQLELVTWEDPEKGGLSVALLAMLIWLVWHGTDVARSFLGGLAFKTLATFQYAIQVGDRVTLKGYSGKIVKIGVFYVTLQTPDDDLVNIPTHALWTDVLISANGGERSSLCVMTFYLAPFATKAQRQLAEDMIWDAMQASPYCETAKPMQIFLSQTMDSICLTAKAYVTLTYDEPLFRSDVTRAFLDVASDQSLPLGVSQWKTDHQMSTAT